MQSKIIKQIAGVFLVLLINAASTLYAQAKPGIFYAVTGKDLKDTSWLFGTYHLINESYLNETPAVHRAFEKSSQLVVEIIADSAALMAANSKALLQEKQLSDFLNKGFSDSLDVALKAALGQGIEQFQALKPMT